MNAKKKVVDPRFAKSKEYKAVISKIENEGKCPFCPENFRYHKNPILKESRGWFITKSSWPYTHAEYHFLLISRKHKEEFSELSLQDFKEARQLLAWAVKHFRIKGGGIALRFGETTFTGATVCHLHFHLIVPKLKKNQKHSETVSFPIG